MSTPKVYLNEDYTKKDGTCAVYILVHLGGKSLKFNTGVSCDPDNFDAQTSRKKGKSKKVSDDNLTIERGLARMNDIFVRYRLQGETLTPEVLKKEWKNPARRVNFFAWMDEALKARKGELADSSLKQHKSLKSKMEKFRKKLAFADIDADYIEQFRRFLKVTMKNDLNTIHNNLKNLKAYLNIARRQGVISENPFDNVKLKRSAPERIFLTEDELNALWTMYEKRKLPDTHHYVLRHFLFMCFTGIRISDLIALTFDGIFDDTLFYFPIKTHGVSKKAAKVPLNKYAKQLIADEGRTTGKVFKLISEQRMNLKIKEIALGAKIPKKLSNHSGRHTFATLYLSKTKDLTGLQRMLGHSNVSQTMVYVHIVEEMMNDEMTVFEAKLFKQKTPPTSAGG